MWKVFNNKDKVAETEWTMIRDVIRELGEEAGIYRLNAYPMTE